MAPIVDGMGVNASNTNAQLLDAVSDDTAQGKLTLANTDTESGTSVLNIQKEHNSAASYMGKSINTSKDALPTWANNDAGTSLDDLTARAEALTQKFNLSSGHRHSGSFGEGAPIHADDIVYVNLRGYFIQATALTGVTGSSLDVSTQMTGKNASNGDQSKGVVVQPGYNQVVLRQASGANIGDQFKDSLGNVVYGKISYSSPTWTLSFFTLVGSTETQYSFSSSTDINWFYQELYNPISDAPVYSELAVIPSDNVTADVMTATATLQGKVSLATSSTEIGSTTSAGTANATVANADHTHRGVHSVSKSGSSLLYGDVTLSATNGASLTQSAQDISIDAPALSSTAAASIASANATGVGTTSARADHTHQGVHSIAKSGSTALYSDVTLSAGANIALTQSSQDISIAFSGILPIANGGTGATTQQEAINALTGTQGSGKYLRSDGTNSTLSNIQAADVPTLNQNTTGTATNITATSNSTLTTLSSLSLPGSQVTGNISGNAANVTGTVAIANGGTGTATGSITGTGALTFTAGGTNQNVTLTPSGTGYTVLNGNVGLGTTSPSYKLDVSGDVRIASGNLGIGAIPTANRNILTASTAQNSTAIGIQLQHYPEATATGSYVWRPISADFRPSVSEGFSNTSGAVSFYSENLRSYRTAAQFPSYDSGTLANAWGLYTAVGHYDQAKTSSPITTTAAGAYIIPYAKSGTITDFIGVFLANKIAQPTPSTWTSASVYAADAIVKPSSSTGFYYATVSGGTSGSAEPTWPTTLGQTVVDGSVTWKTVAIASITNYYGIYQQDTTAKNYFGGNVGIGTTAPGTTFVINHATDPRVTLLYNGTSTLQLQAQSGEARFQAVGASTFLGLWTAGAEKMRIDSSGNVGIGTTSPQSLLHLKYANADGIAPKIILEGSDAPFSYQVRLGTLLGEIEFRGTDSQTTLSERIAASIQSKSEAEVAGPTTVTGNIIFNTKTLGDTALTEKMRITASGNVGIGTTNPIRNLTVASSSSTSIAVMSSAATPAPSFRAYSSRGSAGSESAVQSGDQLGVFGVHGYGATQYSAVPRADMGMFASENWTDTAMGTYIRFATTATGTTTSSEKMRIDSSGNVGIGQASPNNLLDIGSSTTRGVVMVRGTSGATPLVQINNTLASGGKNWALYSGYPTVGDFGIVNATDSRTALTLSSAGNVVIGTAALSTTATNGFLYIDTCAGAPTGTPTSYTGRVPLVYDTTNNNLYIYNGAWKSVTLA